MTTTRTGGATAEVPPDRPELVVHKVVRAPPTEVFEAFTDADALEAWWGPDGFTTTTERFEFRPGGVWDLVMHGPDGTDLPNRLTFEELSEPTRVVYENRPNAAHPGGFRNTFTLEKRDGGMTLVTMRMVFPTVEERDDPVKHGAVEAGKQTLDRLAVHVEGGEPA